MNDDRYTSALEDAVNEYLVDDDMDQAAEDLAYSVFMIDHPDADDSDWELARQSDHFQYLLDSAVQMIYTRV